MDELRALVQRLEEAKTNPPLASELQTWLSQDGLESIKPRLINYLRDLEAPPAVVTHILRFQTGGIHPITYDVPVTMETTVGQVRSHLAAVSGVPGVEQKLLAGSKQLEDDELIYPVWLSIGSPPVLRTVRVEHPYDFHSADRIITLRVPYDYTVMNAILALGPKLGISSARIALETKQGRLNPETTMAEAVRHGPISIAILPASPPRVRLPIQSHHLPLRGLPGTSLEWVPIISEGGHTLNVAVTPDTPLIQIKGTIMRQTGIIPGVQIYTMGNSATALQDDWPLYRTWAEAGYPTINVATRS